MNGESKERDGQTPQPGASEARKAIPAYTYMVRCGDGSLYTGWTYDLDKRVAAHNAGKGAKYTKSRLPVELVYFERFSAKEEAMSREFAIKRLTRKEKLELLRHDVDMRGSE